MPVMFMLLQKLTFDGKFQICQISLLPTDSVIPDHLRFLGDKTLDIMQEMWYLHDGAPPHYAR
jgi:hypothetical protein